MASYRSYSSATPYGGIIRLSSLTPCVDIDAHFLRQSGYRSLNGIIGNLNVFKGCVLLEILSVQNRIILDAVGEIVIM